METCLYKIKLYLYCWFVLRVLVSGSVEACEIVFVSNNTEGSCSPFASATAPTLRKCANLCIMSPDCLGLSYNINTSECSGYNCTSTAIRQGFSFYVKDCPETSTASGAFSTATDIEFTTATEIELTIHLFQTPSLYTDYPEGSDSGQSNPSLNVTSFEVTSSYSSTVHASLHTNTFLDLVSSTSSQSPVAASSLELSESSSETFQLFSATSSSPVTLSEPITVSPTTELISISSVIVTTPLSSTETFSEHATVSSTTELLSVSSGIVTSPLSSSVSSAMSSATPTSTIPTQSSCLEVPVNDTLPKGPHVEWEEVQAFRHTMMRGELFNEVVKSTLHCAVQCSKLDYCRSFCVRMTSGECYGFPENRPQCGANMTFPALGFRYYILTSLIV